MLLQEEYGEMTHIYAISAFLLVLFGYGLETSFFRYALKEENNLQKSYGTALTSILGSTLLFGALLFLFQQPLAQLFDAGSYQHLLLFIFVVVLLDSLTSIPFAYLRATNKPVKFAVLKLGGIAINIGLNLFFYIACPIIMKQGDGVLFDFVSSWYNPRFGVGYALIANVADSAFKLLILGKDYFKYSGKFDGKLWRKMLSYGWPILIVSFAGMVNEVADRQLLKWLLPGSEEEQKIQLGIYSACYKLSIFLSLFTQAFRYAGEPFFFAQAKEKDAKITYALVLKYFTIVSLTGFLIVALFIDIFKHFLSDPDYWVGLGVVPILLMAYVFYGMYYNMSVWYKLSDKTRLGGLVAIIGAVVTIAVNVLFIPKFGYWASAWATLLCFLLMVIVSKFWGAKHYKIDYRWSEIIFYIMLSVIIFGIVNYLQQNDGDHLILNLILALFGVTLFLLVFYFREKREINSLLKR